MSTIAAHTYGSSADWPAVWWANRSHVANPNAIAAGQKLQLPASGKVPSWMARDAAAAAGDSASAAAPAVAVSSQQSDSSAPAQTSAPVSTAASSGQSSGGNWAAIAACESGGNWSSDTGNGFYGGLQFTQQTWDAYGGGKYASSANEASESDQIAVAQNVLAGQGIGAWPVCGAGG